jgi:hypothetical protein
MGRASIPVSRTQETASGCQRANAASAANAVNARQRRQRRQRGNARQREFFRRTSLVRGGVVCADGRPAAKQLIGNVTSFPACGQRSAEEDDIHRELECTFTEWLKGVLTHAAAMSIYRTCAFSS